ncbi:hypothetical protein ACJX0J_025081, partial [Zea mays]
SEQQIIYSMSMERNYSKKQHGELGEVPHPWLNLLIPRSSIRRFAKEVFGKILKDSNNGPILLYPVNKS